MNDVTAKLPDDIRYAIKRCTVVVICVSRGYKTNMACQKVARYALTQEKNSILLFALFQGDYTLNSDPDKVNGWLGYMIRGELIVMCI